MAAHPELPAATGPEAGYDELPDDVEQLKAMLLAERARAARLEHILKLINRTTFGKRSEKLPVDQLALALEDQAVALGEAQGLQDKADEETERYGLRPRRRRPLAAERASLPAHLPRIEVVIEPDSLECACGGALHKIGEDRSERLDIIPAQHRVVVTVRPRYACRCCTDGVHQAAAPVHVVPGGLPTEALIANVLINKYCDHLPLYRQSKMFARQGIAISRATLANWVGRGIAALMPITNRLRDDALARSRLFVDETSVTSDAMKYALKRWGGFTRFLDDGRIELDNNTAERAIRPVTLQRKNALFAGHQLGAENWAAIASLVETCKMLDIEPYAYLCDVLARIITRSDTDPIDDLLPYNWVDTNAGQSVFEMSNIASAA